MDAYIHIENLLGKLVQSSKPAEVSPLNSFVIYNFLSHVKDNNIIVDALFYVIELCAIASLHTYHLSLHIILDFNTCF